MLAIEREMSRMDVARSRRRFGLLIALAAIAVPLLAAGPAHAAMAGANPATTGLRPALRSAQITSFNSTTGATTIQVCFDQAISSTPFAAGFQVGSYRQAETAGDSASRDPNGRCANVVYSSSFIDPQQRTYVHVDLGAVVNPAIGAPAGQNGPDSVALNGSNSHNGTRGHATSPDLEGITLSQAPPAVNYVMDEPVAGAANGAGDYSVTLQDGTTVPNPGGGVTFSGNTVTVPYAPGTLGSPGNQVVRGTVEYNRVAEATQGITNVNRMTATAPGTGGFSSNPDLIAITVSADGQTADFTFDENILPAGGSISGGSLYVGTSDSLNLCFNAVALTAADIVNGNTVRVTTPNLACGGGVTPDQINEYFVWGDVDPGIVEGTGAPAGRTNPVAGIPTGTNQGAFANGFTTGPEAFSTAFDTSTGVVTINLDQRFASFNTPSIILVDDSGSETPFSPTTVSGSGGPAGPTVARAQFTPGEVAGARSLFLSGATVLPPAFVTANGYGNVDQILSPTPTAKRQHKHRHVVRHKAHGVHVKMAQKQALRNR